MSQLVNTYGNEETLPYHSLTNPDISSTIGLPQESCHLGNQNSISPYHFEVDQNKNLRTTLIIWQPLKLNKNVNVNSILKLVIQFHFLTQC